MASITSLSNSMYKSNSIYGNRNVLSGLASGMDTEQMIENAVSGIKLKIQNLQKKRTKIEWQQEAYRSIVDKMVNLDQKYSSYASGTNLLSNSFFSNAVNSVAKGTYADKVSATGKTSSDVKINAVRQLATAATYTVSGLGGARSGELQGITAGKGFDITKDLDISTVSGTLSLKYGGENGTEFDISFGELENLNEVKVLNADGTEKTGATNAEKLAQAINDKLSEIDYKYTKNGIQENKKASDAIKASVDDAGNIVFKDGLGNGNLIKLSAAGNIKNIVSGNSLVGSGGLTKKVSTAEYLGGKQGTDNKWSGGKELSITFNGTTKKISMSDLLNKVNENYEANTAAGKSKQTQFNEALQAELDDAFGKGKITVGQDGDGKLSLTPKGKGDTMILGGTAAEGLGFQTGDANYINTGKKLSDILGDKAGSIFTADKRLTAVGKVNTETMTDEAGNKVKLRTDADGNAVTDKDGKEIYDRVDKDGKVLYDFKLNGASIAVNEDTTLESLMNSINSNADAGVKVSYSKLTNEFKFTATETGANSKIEFEGVAKSLFGDTSAGTSYTAGQDAVMDVEINGVKFEGLTRSSNTFDIDGLNVTVKGTFETAANEEAVTFQASTDTDKIVDAIKAFVNDYNEMVTELKSAYSTMPAQKSNGARYEPLTAEEEDKYSESELKAYNEKAKQGILFGDRDLSRAYEQLLSAISPSGMDGKTLREIGLDTSYSGGLTTIDLDESKLRAALENDPDKVRNAFTKSRESGASSDGLMTSLKNTLDAYAKYTGEPKGILIQKAGSVKSPTSLNNNTLLSQMNNLDSQIERWTDKMADQIDRYTSKFSKLEQLIAEMNSQSSALMGLMGGSGSY